MKVQALIEAYVSPQYQQWKETHPGEDESKIIELIQTYSFQSWIKSNPNGTVDQYLNHCQLVRQHQQTPQYKIELLEDQIEVLEDHLGELRASILELQKDNEALRSEICEKDVEISSLCSWRGSLAITTLLFLITTVVLFIRYRKSRIF